MSAKQFASINTIGGMTDNFVLAAKTNSANTG